MINRTCLHCKKEFNFRGCPTDIESGRGKYCSKKCSRVASRTLPRTYKCKECGKRIKNTEGRKRIYCSLTCRYKSQIGKIPNNKGTKATLITRIKQSIARTGKIPWNKGITAEKSHSWMGGISKNYGNYYIKRKQREKEAIGNNTLEEWEMLKKQYNYTCPCCNKSEPEIKLGKDHIIPLSKGGSNYISNIQPLCRYCNAKKNTKIIFYVVKTNTL